MILLILHRGPGHATVCPGILPTEALTTRLRPRQLASGFG